MSAEWTTILCLAGGTVLIKGSGPVLLGGRELPEAVRGVIALLASALLAALVVTQTFAGHGGDLVLDARAPAMAVAGVAIALRRSPLTVMAAAAVAAALIRLVT